MPTLFSPAFEYVIRNEDAALTGRVTGEPNGGRARFGVNSIFHPKAIVDKFYTMDKARALEYAQTVYMRDYWFGKGFSLVNSQQLASKLLDMAINMGNGEEMKILQMVIEVPITYHMDEATRTALDAIDETFMPKLIESLKAHYQEIHDKHPRKYSIEVLNGWLQRATKLPPL